MFLSFYKKARVALSCKNIDEVKIAEHILAKEDCEGIQKMSEGRVALELENLGFIKQDIEIASPHMKLEEFLKKDRREKKMRDYFATNATSGLSVDLRFGTISIGAILRALFSLKGADIAP